MAALSPCDSTSATTAQTLSALGEERGQTCLHEELTVSRGTRKKQGPAKVPELQGELQSFLSCKEPQTQFQIPLSVELMLQGHMGISMLRRGVKSTLCLS